MVAILTAIFVAAFIFLIGFFVNVWNRSKYWKRRGIPGPEGGLFTGNLDDLFTFEFPYVVKLYEWSKKYGPFYGFREGWMRVLVISDVEMVQEMLVKKFECFQGRKLNPLVGDVDTDPKVHLFNARGTRWKRLRTIANPSFSVANLKRLTPLVFDSISHMMEHLDQAYTKEKPFNIHLHFHELTMDVIGRVALGQKESKIFNNPNVEIAKKIFYSFSEDRFSYLAAMFPFISPWLRKIHLATMKFRGQPLFGLMKDLYGEIYKRMKERAEGNHTESIDFIDLFLDGKADEIYDDPIFDKRKLRIAKKLTVDEIAYQCIIFILAGFDTTANSSAVMCYYLAKNPLIQKRLQEEIDDIVGEDDATYSHTQDLRFLDACFNESLRLVPVATFATTRQCCESTTLGNLFVEKGTEVCVDAFSLHRNRELWGEDADEYVPDRWFSAGQEHHLAFTAFGGGPRTCIGMRLAQLEEKMAMIEILKKYTIKECPETEKKIELIGMTTIAPKSVTVKLEKRNK
uniref:Cytochrome P450 n=1 Tax=Panagrolaimus sp. PS1159 TaxID=55785 RepID=A0AC35G216_9BILA